MASRSAAQRKDTAARQDKCSKAFAIRQFAKHRMRTKGGAYESSEEEDAVNENVFDRGPRLQSLSDTEEEVPHFCLLCKKDLNGDVEHALCQSCGEAVGFEGKMVVKKLEAAKGFSTPTPAYHDLSITLARISTSTQDHSWTDGIRKKCHPKSFIPPVDRVFDREIAKRKHAHKAQTQKAAAAATANPKRVRSRSADKFAPSTSGTVRSERGPLGGGHSTSAWPRSRSTSPPLKQSDTKKAKATHPHTHHIHVHGTGPSLRGTKGSRKWMAKSVHTTVDPSHIAKGTGTSRRDSHHQYHYHYHAVAAPNISKSKARRLGIVSEPATG